MDSNPIFQELRPAELPLEQIYLDPNNPRFVQYEWAYVPNSGIVDAQARTRELLSRPEFAVDKLQMNMEVNGYLPIDRVVVRQFEDGKYVVLEGNRRICAAQNTARILKDLPNGELLEPSFRTIPCLIYTGTTFNAAWIFQGLRHISGINEWSAFAKAKLLVDQMEEEDLQLTEVGKRFGLTPHGAGQWVRGYTAFKQAKEESDYISEVHEDSYPYFQEIFGQSSIAIREWLEWSDRDRKFKNNLNLNEFVGWLYPKPDDNEDATGQWDNRRIARRDDIRALAMLKREAADLFDAFRGGMTLEQAVATAQSRKYEEQSERNSDPVAVVFEIIKDCTKRLNNVPLRVVRDSEAKLELKQLLMTLSEAVANVGELLQ